MRKLIYSLRLPFSLTPLPKFGVDDVVSAAGDFAIGAIVSNRTHVLNNPNVSP